MAFQANAFQNNAFQVEVAGVGGAGAATFAMLVDDGASVTYAWQTDVTKSLSGLEQRAACRNKPRQRYEFSTLMTDAQHRALLSTFAGYAVDAPLFLLGLTYEAAVVISSTASTITVDDLALSDWAAPGQRIVVVSPDGDQGEAVVQAAVGDTLNILVDLTSIAVEGALVMPAVGVYLDAEQGLARYAVNAGTWSMVARAERNGFAGGAVGTGATINTYDGLPVWDMGIAIEQAAQPLYSGAELVDLGGRISMLGSYEAADWGRAIRIESSSRADWQWLKAFLDTIQGRRRAFLLPSGRPDLVPISDASTGTLTVEGPPVEDAPDYANDWFPSLAHRRLKLVRTDGTAAYREVVSCSAGTGTQDLALDSPLAGALERVEFLETVRLASDEVTVTWRGLTFDAPLNARVVQR